jgi:hypothetical protein
VKIERRPNGLHATVPLRGYALFERLSQRHREAIDDRALVTRPLGLAMLLAGALCIAVPFDLPSKTAVIEGGSVYAGAILVAFPILIDLERWFWRRLRGGELTVVVDRGRVTATRNQTDPIFTDAALEDCTLKARGNELVLTVQGTTHRLPTSCTMRTLHELETAFDAAREAHGSPEDVPQSLRATARASERSPG